MFDIVERITEKYAKQAKKLEDIYGVGAVLQLAHEMQNLSLEVLFPIVNQYRSQNIDPVVTLFLLLGFVYINSAPSTIFVNSGLIQYMSPLRLRKFFAEKNFVLQNYFLVEFLIFSKSKS